MKTQTGTPRHAREMSALTLFFASDDMDVSIRGMRTEAGVDYWSVFDFINKVCEKESDSTYGRTTFNRLIGDGAEHRAELVSLSTYQKFSGIFTFRLYCYL